MIFFCIFANISLILTNFKSSTSMKKLFALAIVASMSFFSCNNTPAEEPVQDEVGIEETQDQQEQPVADMPEEAQAEAQAE